MQNKSQLINSLNYEFRTELGKLPNSRANHKGTQVYAFQVEFTYAIDQVMRGNAPEVESGINACKRIISQVRAAS